MAALTYAQAGVDRDAADRLVGKIVSLSQKTLNRRVRSAVGGYASLYELDRNRWLAASTDGVGTKLKLAFRLREHRTVGIDLVAMSVNDLICVGAEPLFFLDYFATGRLETGVAEDVLKGIVEGCRQAGCALVGGETAEMPDFYARGEYDLGGFAVGSVAPRDVLPRKEIRPGDVLIGLASSGAHSNGFSLLRKLLPSGRSGNPVARQLLAPTRIYVKSLLPGIRKGLYKGLAHITGSGFLNVPRMSDRVSYEIALPPLAQRAPVYRWIIEKSALGLDELSQTFNLGVGMVAVVASKDASRALTALRRSGERAWILGNVVARSKSRGCEVLVRDGRERAALKY